MDKTDISKIIKVLKDDHRSYVYVFQLETYGDKKFVYKESREKNKRKWQKFLSFFRGTESKREYYQMKKINSLGLKTAKPIFYNKNFFYHSQFLFLHYLLNTSFQRFHQIYHIYFSEILNLLYILLFQEISKNY